MAACHPINVEISAFSTPECAIKSKSAEYDGARIILYLPQESNNNQKVFLPVRGLLAHYRCVLIKTESATDIPFYDFALFKDEIERAISEGTSISSDRNVREL